MESFMDYVKKAVDIESSEYRNDTFLWLCQLPGMEEQFLASEQLEEWRNMVDHKKEVYYKVNYIPCSTEPELRLVLVGPDMQPTIEIDVENDYYNIQRRIIYF